MSLFCELHLLVVWGKLLVCILKAQKARKLWKIALVLVLLFLFILHNGNPFSFYDWPIPVER